MNVSFSFRFFFATHPSANLRGSSAKGVPRSKSNQVVPRTDRSSHSWRKCIMGWCPGISGPRPKDWWMGASHQSSSYNIYIYGHTCKESVFFYSDACWLFAVFVLVTVRVFLCCVLLLCCLIYWNDVVVGLLLFFTSFFANKGKKKWAFVCLSVACK